MVRRVSGGFNVGIDGGGKGSTRATIQWDQRVFTTNDTLFVVGSYDFNSATSQSDAGGRLWINPDASTFVAASTPPPDLISTGNNKDLARVAGFLLMENPGGPSGQLDDLRVGTNWASITGGPAVYGLTIAQQPANQTQNAGATATFSVSVVGGKSPLTYQWRKDGVDLIEGGNISGASSATLVISNLVQTDAGGYLVEVDDAEGSVTSAVAVLTVNDPIIIRHPVNEVVRPGTTARFHVAATGAGPLTYRWYKDGAVVSDTGRISGAASPTLTIGDVSAADTGAYFVRVENRFGSAVDSSRSELYLADPSLNGRRPNIIFILTDDLGYGDLGVLYQNARAPGLPRETTPHLDILAARGNAVANALLSRADLCSVRASLLLGVHQGHANVRDEQWDKAMADNHTLANVLQEAGYATAAIGKWGMGGDDVGGTTPAEWAAFPTKRGFDYFFGYERHADAHEHYPKEAINSNGSKQCWDGTNNITSKLDKCYTTDLFTARAKNG